MPAERVMNGYLLRVSVRRHRLHLTLHDLRTGQHLTFRSFDLLLEHLERVAAQNSEPAPDTGPRGRC